MDSVIDASNCLIPELKHQWEFYYAESGQTVWTCPLCGRYTNEWEDSTP